MHIDIYINIYIYIYICMYACFYVFHYFCMLIYMYSRRLDDFSGFID
jgi:hypothetical protein